MRTLMLGTTSALALSAVTLAAPAPARADGLAFHQVTRLSGELSQVDRLNRSRPRDEVYAAIAHVIDLENDRFTDLQLRRMDPRQALQAVDDGLYNILQYNSNAGLETPWVNAQIRRIVSGMRAEVAELLAGGSRPRPWSRGYGQGYVPPPQPAERYYAPPPAPAYAPAPPAYGSPPCDSQPVRPIRY